MTVGKASRNSNGKVYRYADGKGRRNTEGCDGCGCDSEKPCKIGGNSLATNFLPGLDTFGRRLVFASQIGDYRQKIYDVDLSPWGGSASELIDVAMGTLTTSGEIANYASAWKSFESNGLTFWVHAEVDAYQFSDLSGSGEDTGADSYDGYEWQLTIEIAQDSSGTPGSTVRELTAIVEGTNVREWSVSDTQDLPDAANEGDSFTVDFSWSVGRCWCSSRVSMATAWIIRAWQTPNGTALTPDGWDTHYAVGRVDDQIKVTIDGLIRVDLVDGWGPWFTPAAAGEHILELRSDQNVGSMGGPSSSFGTYGLATMGVPSSNGPRYYQKDSRDETGSGIVIDYWYSAGSAHLSVNVYDGDTRVESWGDNAYTGDVNIWRSGYYRDGDTSDYVAGGEDFTITDGHLADAGDPSPWGVTYAEYYEDGTPTGGRRVAEFSGTATVQRIEGDTPGLAELLPEAIDVSITESTIGEVYSGTLTRPPIDPTMPENGLWDFFVFDDGDAHYSLQGMFRNKDGPEDRFARTEAAWILSIDNADPIWATISKDPSLLASCPLNSDNAGPRDGPVLPLSYGLDATYTPASA